MDGYGVINKELDEKIDQLQDAVTYGHLSVLMTPIAIASIGLFEAKRA